ncbi:MAG: hypothetical protein EP343_17685 [Deltaproteobacteria bacterium]|nr:MAG: hypothetical protein EP343_17685 [Deltaproteobacteria bacterium]
MSVGLLGSYTAGLLTFLTPCVLPLIPIYFSMLLGGPLTQIDGEQPPRWRLFGHTLLFTVGFLAVFVTLGLSATFIGQMLGSHRETFTLLGGLLIFLFGLKFLGFLKISWLDQDKRLDSHKLNLSAGALNSLVMGFVFALGWTPCVGPILGAVLTYTASQTNNVWMGGLYLGLYGLGFATPLLVASLAAGTVLPSFRRLMQWLPKLERGTGALLAGVGLYVMLGVVHVPTPKQHVANASSGGPNALTRTLQTQKPAFQGLTKGRPQMIEFVSSHCPICRQMIPTVATLEHECARQQKLVDIVKIDISLPQNQALARQYRIRGVPTFVFLTAKGQETSRLVGFQRIHALRQSIALLSGSTCQGMAQVKAMPLPKSYFAQYVSARSSSRKVRCERHKPPQKVAKKTSAGTSSGACSKKGAASTGVACSVSKSSAPKKKAAEKASCSSNTPKVGQACTSSSAH